MSFLSRRSSRPDQRGGNGGAGRHSGSEYDEYDYAPGDYEQDDDNWSPDEYFSPEGIKGKWAAGAQPGDRPGGRGRHADGRGYAEPGAGYDDYGSQQTQGPQGGYGRDSYYRGAYGQDGGTGDDDYGTGGYDLPETAEDDQSERGGGRRRRDRGERGERRRRRGRRDKGDDIWPDDGVSDEDY